jgi:hypothetical protein
MKKYIAFLLAVSLSFSVYSAEDVKEMVMPTEVGEIVLTLEECPIKNNYGFDYYGYATDPGNPHHFGCWNADDAVVQIWFINENVVGIYNKTLFKPRTTV